MTRREVGSQNVDLGPDDEYETEEQAAARLDAQRQLVAPAIELDVAVETQYAAFNDAETWEPLFASGELDASLRFQVDDPLFTGSLRSTTRYADLRNDERAREGKMDKYGRVIVRERTVTITGWKDVSYDELDRARGR